MSGSNSLVANGILNRVLTHITFASYPALNIGAQNMGSTYAHLNFEGDFTQQPEVAVGVVNSPEPFVMASISTQILRTQPLGAAWLSQVSLYTVLGVVNVYPDSPAFPNITISDVVVRTFNTEAFDGRNPAIDLVLRGVYYPNNSLWS